MIDLMQIFVVKIYPTLDIEHVEFNLFCLKFKQHVQQILTCVKSSDKMQLFLFLNPYLELYLL